MRIRRTRAGTSGVEGLGFEVMCMQRAVWCKCVTSLHVWILVCTLAVVAVFCHSWHHENVLAEDLGIICH